MRTKITLALIFINVLLGVFIFYLRNEDKKQHDTADARSRILGAEIVNITDLSVTDSANKTTLALHRNDTNSPWLITSPIDWPANDFAVERILSELRFLKHETSFLVEDLEKNGQTLADYGLNPPREYITLTRPAATPDTPALLTTIGIGDSTKTANRLYILSPDKTRVHVVSRTLLDSLAQNLSELRSENLFTIPVFEARSLTIQTTSTDGPRVRLRRDTTRWLFETPFAARASKNATEITLNSLHSLRANHFFLTKTDTPDTLTKLSTPTLRIAIEGNNRREILLVGAPLKPATAPATPPAPNNNGNSTLAPENKKSTAGNTTEYYTRLEDRDQVFTTQIPDHLINTLLHAQKDLRDPRILDINPSTLSTLTLNTPDSLPFTLQRLDATGTSTDWQIRSASPTPLPADPALIKTLIDTLTLLTASDFLSDAPSAAQLETYGFNRPELEITLTLQTPAPNNPAGSSTTQLTLQFAQTTPADPSLNVRILGQAFIYTIPATTLTKIPTTPSDYRLRTIRTLPEGTQITALTLTKLSAPADGTSTPQQQDPSIASPYETILYTHTLAQNQTWPETLSTLAPEKSAALDALLAHLRTQTAQRILSNPFNPESLDLRTHSLPWTYRLTATLHLAGSSTPQTYTLYFTERTGGTTQYAGSPADSLVYEIPQPQIDALNTLSKPPLPPQ